MDENRLALIRRWSMDGTCEDLGMRVDAPRETSTKPVEDEEPSDEVAEPSWLRTFMAPPGEAERPPGLAEPGHT